ncbi:DUF885 domain-containing protein [Hanstruepera ponticola]|uniref:DUF885 domain-containing protein n=1 Tax=Hanstruepera ponticola TaxID=2042995 RepID=UPI0017834F4C|nr:DUF885 domain-containing protein [Hanstruepera ponticola]
MRTFLSIFCLVIVLASCKDEKTEENTETAMTMPNEDFNKLLDSYYEEGLQLNPLNATYAGDNRYNDQFPNMLSKSHIDKTKSYYTKYLNELNNIADSTLTDSQKMSKAILKWEVDMALEAFNFKHRELVPIDQMWSPHLSVGQLASGAGAQPFETVEDYNNWLKRLDGYTEWLQSVKNNMEKGITEGYVLPKSLIVKVLPQIESGASNDIENHLFYSPINNMPDSFSDEDKATLKDAYTAKLNDKIIPAYKSLYDFLKTDYVAAGRESSGINDTPNGAAYYNYMIKLFTTTNMTADEIHNLGLKEVERISAEMEKVKEQVGFEGDLKSFFNHVRTNKELMPFDDPQEVIDNFNAIHETMKPQINKLFDVKPKTAFEVRRTEAFREASASAEYNQGSLDGTRPGIFYVPIPDVTAYNIFSDEALFLHEAIPGHHYQISLQQEDTNLPQFRKTLWYSAYGEGWALYSESLGKELGLYTDPYQYFGMLGMEMHRAIRLVVDTGLHSKGWTREEAIQYSLDHEAESEASITSEIERYMAMPGQALSYKIGQLKIKELRAKAERELGTNFDISEFHNEVLEPGCVPLALLEDKINAWISANK